MRINLPVHNHEHELKHSDRAVSMADTEGKITYVNGTFCEISGFSEDELLGQPHNVVRHPDMPSAVFADLWATLDAGKEWRGLIKNRRKDGGFYWVETNADPIHVDGTLVGYTSLHTRPSPHQVAQAERVHAALHRARASTQWLLRSSRIGSAGWRGVSDRLHQPRLRERIAGVVTLLALAGLIAAASVLAWITASDADLASHRRAKLLASQPMDIILHKMMENRILTLDTASRTTPETLAACRRRVVANHADIAALVGRYRASIDTPEQQQLLDHWNVARLRYNASIDAALAALKQGEHERATEILVNQLPQRYQPLVDDATVLIEQHANAVDRAFRDAEARSARHWIFASMLLLVVAALAAWRGVALLRMATRPPDGARRLPGANGMGDLTAGVAHHNDGEIGGMVPSTLDLHGLARDVAIASAATGESAIQIATAPRKIGLSMVEQTQTIAHIAEQARDLRENATAQLEAALTAHTAAAKTAEEADAGRWMLQQIIHSVDVVRQTANRIGNIAAAMTSLAIRTDVLALNASESARTGAHQRAFSQIVDEIHNLAQRSHSASGDACALMAEIVTGLDRGSETLSRFRETLDGIRAESSHVLQLMTSNIEGARAQAAGTTAVDTELAQLTRIAVEGTELSLRAVERAARLRGSAERLLQRMSPPTPPADSGAPADNITPDQKPPFAAFTAATGD
jgi:PAS domain S-box-containing protein